MSLFGVFDIAGSSLSAQTVRLNTIASNIANAGVVSGSEQGVYRARYPVFATAFEAAKQQGVAGVRVEGITEARGAPRKEYMPSHPLADDQGYIFTPDVSVVSEMANMISASRSYQSSIEAMNTTKQLLLRTINIGR